MFTILIFGDLAYYIVNKDLNIQITCVLVILTYYLNTPLSIIFVVWIIMYILWYIIFE